MDKVLPGASREALAFIAVHWKSLLQMSVIPFLAYLIVTVWQVRSLGAFYRSMGNAATDPNFASAYMRSTSLSFLGSLVAMCLIGLLFAQIVRFHRTGVAGWIMTDKASITAGLMTLVYGIGIALLTLLAYLVGVIAIAILATILGVILGVILGSTAAGVVAVILGVLGGLAMVAGLYWFMCRFFVGLPGVALGSSPDFFKDMWPLSKGETWGLPLRLLLATVVAYVPIIFLLFVFIGPQWLDLITKMAEPQNANNPATMFPIMADLMDQMLPASMAMMIVYIPFLWFVALLLGIAFQRFRARG